LANNDLFFYFRSMLKATNIHKSYGSLEILKGIDLEVQRGEIISIIGASGAGKSTLLHIIGTLDTSDKGEVLLDGTNINRLSSKQLSDFRNKNIGFIFQFHHLLPEFTALENVCIPSFIAGISKRKAEEKALALLNMLGVDHRKEHKPNELSGGEQQRVAIARALINDPKIVLADEPSGNLDSANAEEMNRLFLKLRDELKQTFIIVTHNDKLANIADRKLIMKDGRFLM
jgi:lipoprotein-releasing system ATP-binding protein